MSIDPAIVTNVRPRKKARIGSEVPFPFLLQQLEFCGPVLLDRCGSDVTWAGGDTAVGLDFCGVGAVVSRQVVSGLYGAVSIPQGKAIRSHRKAGVQ